MLIKLTTALLIYRIRFAKMVERPYRFPDSRVISSLDIIPLLTKALKIP